MKPATVWYRHLPPITRDEPTADGDRIVVVSPGATLVTGPGLNRFALAFCRAEDAWDPRKGLALALRRWRKAARRAQQGKPTDELTMIPNTPANRSRFRRLDAAMELARLWFLVTPNIKPPNWTETPVVLPPPGRYESGTARDVVVTAEGEPVRGVKGVELPFIPPPPRPPSGSWLFSLADGTRLRVPDSLLVSGDVVIVTDAQVNGELAEVTREPAPLGSECVGDPPAQGGPTSLHGRALTEVERLRRLATRYRREAATEHAARLAAEAKAAAGKAAVTAAREQVKAAAVQLDAQNVARAEDGKRHAEMTAERDLLAYQLTAERRASKAKLAAVTAERDATQAALDSLKLDGWDMRDDGLLKLTLTGKAEACYRAFGPVLPGFTVTRRS